MSEIFENLLKKLPSVLNGLLSSYLILDKLLNAFKV